MAKDKKDQFKRPSTLSPQAKTIVPLGALTKVGDGANADTKELVSSGTEKDLVKSAQPQRGRGAPKKKGKEDWIQTTVKLPKDMHFNLNMAKLLRTQKEGKAVPVEDLIYEALVKAGYDKPPKA